MTRKETIDRMEAFFDKPREVYAIKIYKHLVVNCQLQKLLNSLEN